MKKLSLLLNMATVAALSISSMAQASHIDVSGLIHLWAADGNVTDSIGSADGTLGASTTYGSGVNGQAFDFDGTDLSDLTLPVDIGPTALPQMTMGMFINVQSFDNTNDWIMGHDNGGFDRSLIASDGRFGAGLAAGVGGTYTSSLTNLGDNLGSWFGIAVSYDQSAATATIYINDLFGSSSIQTVATSLGDGNSFASVGGLSSFGGHGLDALVDDVFIYDRALSQSELDTVFAASEVPEPSTLLIFSAALLGYVGLRRNKKS
jgi:hypothetical protein